jgi:hypothetical protein
MDFLPSSLLQERKECEGVKERMDFSVSGQEKKKKKERLGL